MSQIRPALNFLKKDIDQVHQQYVGPKQWMSLLQRNGVELQDLLDLFDPLPDENDWLAEYGKQQPVGPLLQKYRKRMEFLQAARKEFWEDYNPDRTDCDFMRLMEVPYTDSKYSIDWSLEEMGK